MDCTNNFASFDCHGILKKSEIKNSTQHQALGHLGFVDYLGHQLNIHWEVCH